MGKIKLSMWKCYSELSDDNYKCNFCDQKFKKKCNTSTKTFAKRVLENSRKHLKRTIC